MRKPSLLAPFLPLVVLSCLPGIAAAQVGVYGLFDATRISSLTGQPSVITGRRLNSTSPVGGVLGVYYDFRNFGPVRVGVDLRGSLLRTKRGADEDFLGAGTHINSFLGGVRVSFRTPIKVIQLKPYLQASAGLGRSDFGLSPNLSNGFEYHGYAGVDIKLLPVLDWRAVELGYGGIDGNGHNYPLGSVSTGFVVHLP
jgi:hypothetical protein